MKSRLPLVYLFTLLAIESVAQLNVVPNLQEWTPANGSFMLTPSSKLIYQENDEVVKRDLQTFAEELEKVSGIEIIISNLQPKKGDLIFASNTSDISTGKDSYSLGIGSFIKAEAGTPGGMFYAMQTLLQLFSQGRSIAKGMIKDYPVYEQRSVMLDVGRKYFEIDYLEKLIRDMAWKKLNFLHLHFTEWHSFRLKSELFPGLAAEKSYSKADIRRIQDYARRYHVVIIPEIDLPAHATAITNYNAYLGFHCESMRKAKWQSDSTNRNGGAWMLDITRTEVRSWIRALLDEWIPLFDGPYFHIGGDEYQFDADKYACPELVEAMNKKGYKYPGDIIVDWINETNEQVKSFGKITQIWNWWSFSPSQENQNRTSLQPARDIIINVWNRVELEFIIQNGYNVIVTSETGEEGLYITPGLAGVKAGDYGFLDARTIYEKWKPQTDKAVKGFKICIWSDQAEHQPDAWFNQFADLPKAVLAERTWGSPKAGSIEKFQERVKMVGDAPFNNKN